MAVGLPMGIAPCASLAGIGLIFVVAARKGLQALAHQLVTGFAGDGLGIPREKWCGHRYDLAAIDHEDLGGGDGSWRLAAVALVTVTEFGSSKDTRLAEERHRAIDGGAGDWRGQLAALATELLDIEKIWQGRDRRQNSAPGIGVTPANVPVPSFYHRFDHSQGGGRWKL